MSSFKNFISKIKWQSYLTAIIAIALGVILVIFPNQSLNTICYVAGGILVVVGIVGLIKYFKSSFKNQSHLFLISVLALILGLILLIKPEKIQGILMIILGLFIIVDSLLRLEESVEGYCVYKENQQFKNWWLLLIFALTSLALGLLIVFDIFSAKYIVVFCGISLIIDGLLDFTSSIIFGKKIKNALQVLKENA